MKQTSFPLLLLLLSLATAVQAQKNGLKLGATFGPSAYEEINAVGLHLQYERSLAGRWSLNLGAGQMLGKLTQKGTSNGSENGVSWSNTYEYKEKESFSHIDLSLLYALQDPASKSNVKVGIGPSFGQASLEYPVDIFIRRGIIERNVAGTHTASTVMANLMAEFDLNFSKQFFFHASAIFRTAFSEKSVLERKIQMEDGYSSSTSGILSQYAFGLGLGYRF